MELTEGAFIVLITTNNIRATGVVMQDPCKQTMVKYIDENGVTGNAYEQHIKNWAEIETDWEEGNCD